ncbi:MAG TPA: class I SAM-dependent methyltransferase [Bryobacteraceae bacterium]|nr:class I SAM-dependent methyltransferase [Bryobacteraceae bacterium]
MAKQTGRVHDCSIEAQEEPFSYAVEFENGGLICQGEGRPTCTFIVHDERSWLRLQRSDPYQIARAFIASKFAVEGDLVEAIKIYRSVLNRHPGFSLNTVAIYLWHLLGSVLRRGSSAQDVKFHYDRSNEFYRLFLDSRMVYSCAYFKTKDTPLDAAQLAKLEHICRKLRLYPGDRFLDVGCGWGSLVLHSASQYGTFSTGCTLSSEQRFRAVTEAERQNLSTRAKILECDYRDVIGKFDKIASIGMFEHVGRRDLHTYFEKMHMLLADGGLFLNHGIVRPQQVRSGPEALFLARHVFPGGELVRLTDVIESAENAGFEVFDIENLRPHYALTCRAWVNRLCTHRDECLQYIDVELYQTWLLYLAASAASFEAGDTEIHQALFVKRGEKRPLTRDYIYL